MAAPMAGAYSTGSLGIVPVERSPSADTVGGYRTVADTIPVVISYTGSTEGANRTVVGVTVPVVTAYSRVGANRTWPLGTVPTVTKVRVVNDGGNIASVLSTVPVETPPSRVTVGENSSVSLIVPVVIAYASVGAKRTVPDIVPTVTA